MDARIIACEAAAGDWNMAVDEALLETAQRSGTPCLRFYFWSPATLSLGYFQSAAQRQAHAASSAAPLVRRATGGGAILHHLELTYSFTTPAQSRSQAESQTLYHAFHETARDELRRCGVTSQLWEHDTPQAVAEPFLCFLRRARGDLVVGPGSGTKLLGSAQRRSRGALLQHGSLILGQSPLAPEIEGLAEYASRLPQDVNELRQRWSQRLADRLGLRWVSAELTEAERERAAKLRGEKFGSSVWNDRR